MTTSNEYALQCPVGNFPCEHPVFFHSTLPVYSSLQLMSIQWINCLYNNHFTQRLHWSSSFHVHPFAFLKLTLYDHPINFKTRQFFYCFFVENESVYLTILVCFPDLLKYTKFVWLSVPGWLLKSTDSVFEHVIQGWYFVVLISRLWLIN